VDVVIGIAFVLLVLLIPAGFIAAVAYVSRRQSTRRGATKRLWVLLLLAGASLVFGYVITQGESTPDGCPPNGCMIDLSPLVDYATWIAVGAAAFVLVLFALQTVWTLLADDFEDAPPRHPPGTGTGHPPGGMQDPDKTD